MDWLLNLIQPWQGAVEIKSVFQSIGSCFTDAGCNSGSIWEDLAQTGSDIVGGFTSGFAHVIAGIFSFLPQGGTLPQVFHDAALYFGNMLATVNWILPVDALIYCLTFILWVKIVLWAFHIVRFFYGLVRGVSFSPFDSYSPPPRGNA